MRGFNFNMAINEARDFSKMTVTKEEWNSISSIYSKSDDDAVSAKPRKTLMVDELVNRYAAALVLKGKPEPKTRADIEEIGSFKLYAYRALELGATMEDIIHAYRINAGLEQKVVRTEKGAIIDADGEIAANVAKRMEHDDSGELYKNTFTSSDKQIEIKHYDDDDDDEYAKIENDIISKGMQGINQTDEIDEEDVKKWLDSCKMEGTNEIECKLHRSDYGSDEEFIQAFNDYLNNYSEKMVPSYPNYDGKVGYATEKYLAYGDLVSVDGILDGDLYITTDPEDPRRYTAHSTMPMTYRDVQMYNPWIDDSRTGMPVARIPESFIAGKLIEFFRQNGIKIKTVYVNDEMENPEEND